MIESYDIVIGYFPQPFYLPMAFFIPPTHAIVHKEFNLLYQFWIHTEVIRSIGPLEYILNTASHHRVHHGINNLLCFGFPLIDVIYLYRC